MPIGATARHLAHSGAPSSRSSRPILSSWGCSPVDTHEYGTDCPPAPFDLERLGLILILVCFVTAIFFAWWKMRPDLRTQD
jgi:hypothetical protein